MQKQILERFDIPGLHYEFSEIAVNPSYHDHKKYEIYIMLSGECVYFIKDKSYKLKPDDIAFIDENSIHKSSYVTDSYSRIFFYVENSFLDENTLDALKKLCANAVYTPENPEYVKKQIAKIRKELTVSDSVSADLIKCYMTEFIAYCTRNKSLYAKNEIQNPIIERLVEYINNNYNHNITLSESAKSMNMSNSYLSRLFKNVTGFSFKEYLLIIRIKHAKELLSATRKSIKQISVECGFNDSNYFSKSFKDETGLSPMKYRRLMNE